MHTQWNSPTINWGCFGSFLTEHTWPRNTHLHAWLDLSQPIQIKQIFFQLVTLSPHTTCFRSSSHQKSSHWNSNISHQTTTQCVVLLLSPSSVVFKPLKTLLSSSSIDKGSYSISELCMGGTKYVQSYKVFEICSALDCYEVGDSGGCQMSTETTETVRTEPVALCSSFFNQTQWFPSKISSVTTRNALDKHVQYCSRIHPACLLHSDRCALNSLLWWRWSKWDL